MSTWLLIIFINVTRDRAAVTMQEFTTRERCEIVRELVDKASINFASKCVER